MKKLRVPMLAGLGLVALFIGGCAGNEAVKKDSAAVPAAVTEKVEPAIPAKNTDANAAQMAPQIQPAQSEASTSTMNVPVEARLETVYFDFDKADLRQDTRDVLAKNADTILKTLAERKIQIEGHCDERGSAEYNLALGERRAKAALKYITTLGVKEGNLSIISYGKEKPAVQGNDESAWAKNRRAEFVVK
ncbi:MAG: peptidoglycan-associated lipoprotein Pal [Desulfuromonadaceae bacterium]|nr:peptidoglycan-associated lipoprotein Pal [Desulfuromonadaceae bacterium]MDD5105132.1 peptidoglycan-associated lipoprotein Pal [Desulfuromonadaceae bacterium]